MTNQEPPSALQPLFDMGVTTEKHAKLRMALSDAQRYDCLSSSDFRTKEIADLFDDYDDQLKVLENAVALWRFSSTDATQELWLDQAKAAIARACSGGRNEV